LLAGDAQRLRCLGRRHLAGANLKDQIRPLPGFGIHLLSFCRSRCGVGKLVYLI
jgi:hypothetical protein